MSTQHPSAALLRRYATGAASPGTSLAIAAHLSACPSCRAQVARYEALAGAFLGGDQITIEACDFDAIEGRLDAEPVDASANHRFDAGPLPRAVANYLDCDYADIPWRFRLPGVYEYELADDDGETISLLKVKPGAAIPQHTHKAEELTVVFDGELIDGGSRYLPGDIAVADGDINHHPKAGGDRDCICLAVLSGGLTFTGPFGRALNLFS